MSECKPRGTGKTLPLHVSAHGCGFRVLVQRGDVIRREYRPTLEEAIAILADMEAEAGPALYPKHHPPRKVTTNNTGIVGIWEVTRWVHYTPRHCFTVATRSGEKRVYFGPRCRSKAAALRIARQIRREGVGAL